MIDPLSAISLASAIVQFVDFSTKIIHGAREVYGSASGATEENRSLEVVVQNMRNLSSEFGSMDPSQQNEDEKALCRLAKECDILSDQIFELLQNVKPKDPNSSFQAIWAALKNKKYERQKSELERRLNGCRSQLELQLNFLTSSETKTRLDTLISSAKVDAGKLGLLQKHVEQLRLGVRVTSISPKAQEQIRNLLDLSEEACRKIRQKRVLNSLAYSDMHGRFETVDTAHNKTFEWIFEDSTKGGNVDRALSSRESFIHWLSAGSGIFHITGKLGSGKSTLMKFLCDHPRTEAELQEWAGDRKLLFANFFFWKAGSVEQRSLTGLFRSLLHDLLNGCPELIPSVLPDLWYQAQLIPWQAETKLCPRNMEIPVAFSSLIQHRNLYKERCFCVFIDGLDEYEDTCGHDYKDLVKLLHDWSAAAPENVKICVSSREYNVFMNAFSNERRLLLQDLTRGDMERYVHDKLVITNNEKDREHLVTKITDRANGIFLWVALVVKSIREQLEDGYQLSDLDRELDTLPDELEELFEHLLKSLSKPGRKRAHRTFAMVLKLMERDGPRLSLFSYSFLEDYGKDPEFSIKASFPYSEMDDAVRRDREDVARKRLNGCCRGLLEVRNDDTTITFTHRSISEFLERKDVRADMNRDLEDFKIEDAISQLFLAELRSEKNGIIDEYDLSFVVYTIIDMRNRSNIDREPYRFQECLNSTVPHHAEADLKDRAERKPWIRYREGAYLGPGGFPSSEGSFYITSPLYISAFLGAYKYVAWKIEGDHAISDNTLRTGFLVLLIESGAYRCVKNLKLLELVLRQGLSPNAILHTVPMNNMFDGEMSFWQHFILFITIYNRIEMAERGIGEMIEKFLEYGADPHFWISIPQESQAQALEKANSGEDILWEITLGRERRKIVTGIYHRPALTQFLVSKGDEVSLEELIIEFLELDNTKAILQLLNKNVELQEQEMNEENVARNQQRGDKGKGVKQDVGVPEPEPEQKPTSEPIAEEEEESIMSQARVSKYFRSWLESAARNHILTFVLGILVAIALPRLWAMVRTDLGK